jgi:hypothetical protein
MAERWMDSDHMHLPFALTACACHSVEHRLWCLELCHLLAKLQPHPIAGQWLDPETKSRQARWGNGHEQAKEWQVQALEGLLK